MKAPGRQGLTQVDAVLVQQGHQVMNLLGPLKLCPEESRGKIES